MTVHSKPFADRPHAAELDRSTARMLKVDMKRISVEKDLLSLHYDHASDKDDGQSAAADKTIMESMFGIDWIREHVVAVSGTYGKNPKTFDSKSDRIFEHQGD